MTGQVDYLALSRDLVDTVESGVYIVQSKKFVYVNPFFAKLTGYSPEELIGTRSFKLVLPQDRQSVRKKATRNLKSRTGSRPYEYRFIKKNGEIMWVTERVSPIEYMGKKATLGSFVDITEHKKTEEALLHSEESYRTILEQMQDSYYEVNLEGNFTFVSDSFCGNLGYSREELVGNNYRLVATDKDIKPVFRAFNQVYRTGEPNKGFVNEVMRKDGSVNYYESSIAPKINERGEIIGFCCVGRDITGRKQLEEAVIKSEERYRTILEQLQDSYYEVDLAGNFTFVNESTGFSFGYSREELIGQNYHLVIPEEDVKAHFAAYNEVYRTGQPNKGFPYRIRRKDGGILFSEVAIDIRRDEQGKVIGFKSVSRDITQRKKAEDALRESEERVRISMENAPDGIYMNDFEGNLLYGNRRCEEIIGYKREELIGKNFLELNILPEDSLARAAEILQDNINGKSTGPDELELICKDGRRVPIEINTSIVQRGGDKVVLAFVRDITERKKADAALKQSEERYRALFDRSLDLVYVRDLKGNFIDANPASLSLLGYRREDIHTLNFASLLDPADFPKTIQIQKELTETGFQKEPSEYRLKRKDGTHLYVETQESVIYHDGKPNSVQGVGRDITERKQLEQKLEEMATHDFLTGLPNRLLLLDRFNIAAALAHRNKARLAIMSLDLDKFKIINDTLGHDAGDQVLKAVSTRLKGTIRASDTLARVGGDEFVLVMMETNQAEDATTIAHKILDSFTEPLLIDGHQLHLTTSIGIAIYPEDAQDMEALTKKSDAAMYYSKGHGRNQFKFFHDGDVRFSGDHRSTA